VADLIGTNGVGLPGAQPATIEKINEIIRGATIKQIRPSKARDPQHGGECLMIELQGGDRLILIAVPQSPLALDPDAPTALIQPLLVAQRRSTLKT
jgi:hypothetical protein